MPKLFDDMTRDEKIIHIQKCVTEAREDCKVHHIFDAEILDFFDYWVPWLISEIQKPKD